MRRASILGAIVLAPACAEQPPAHLSRGAVPVKSACTASSRPAASVGFDVRPGRRHSQAQTIFVTNVGGEARSVVIDQVTRVEGHCSADWGRQTPLNFVDASTSAAPPRMTVEPGQSLELRIGDQRVSATWQCTKLGLAVWMNIGEETVCADAGAWIAERDGEEE